MTTQPINPDMVAYRLNMFMYRNEFATLKPVAIKLGQLLRIDPRLVFGTGDSLPTPFYVNSQQQLCCDRFPPQYIQSWEFIEYVINEATK